MSEHNISIKSEDTSSEKSDKCKITDSDDTINFSQCSGESTTAADPEGDDNEEKIFKPKKLQILIKPFTETKEYQDYLLKKYDEFEERDITTLPNINVPEKIILVVDRAQDDDYTSFKVGKAEVLPLAMLKRSLVTFVNMKHSINEEHQFAIVLLNENDASWLINFTNDVRKVINAIDKITPCEVEDNFDMNLIFEEILPKIVVPEVKIPLYIIRTIIFYGRSYTLPKIEFSEEVKEVLNKPYFICDILITHEPVDKSNHCRKIFKYLQDIDTKGLSYFFPVARNTLRLYNSMVKLLGHGLQRPLQKILRNDSPIND